MNSSAAHGARALALLLGSMASLPLAAATITIDNIDAPGTGFNDTTAVAPIGGTPPNPGTTLGQQRLNVFQQAANQWGALLNSNLTIKVQASMTALTCTATSATLGSAGPLLIVAGFSGGRANTAYAIAEGNALANTDLSGTGSDDIRAQFNVTLDAGMASCLNGEKWFYGLDPSLPQPANTIPLLPVVFHELGHGLGFIDGLDDTTGDYLISGDAPIWAYYMYDLKANKLWLNMTSAERLASFTDDPNLVWTGPRTSKQAHEWLKAGNSLIINTPAALSGNQEVGTATFGPAVPAAGVPSSGFQNLVLVNDGSATPTFGCATPFVNAASVSGKIAVMDRGTCNFTTKVKNAQTAGAIAAIIVNNVVDSLRLPLTMSGTDATITIPSYSVNQELGQAIEADLNASTAVTAKLGYANLGVNQGCVRMFAPRPVLPGSSVSHFHADAFPNLLMEPALNTSIFNKVDLTLPLFADIDWSTNKEEFIFIDGYDLNPCAHAQP
jgi:hypothetical protein